MQALSKAKKEIVKERLKERRTSTLTALRNLFAPDQSRGVALKKVAEVCKVSWHVLSQAQGGILSVTPESIASIKEALEKRQRESNGDTLIGAVIKEIDLNTLLKPTEAEIEAWTKGGTGSSTSAGNGALTKAHRSQFIPGDDFPGGVMLRIGGHVGVVVARGAQLTMRTRMDGTVELEIPPPIPD